MGKNRHWKPKSWKDDPRKKLAVAAVQKWLSQRGVEFQGGVAPRQIRDALLAHSEVPSSLKADMILGLDFIRVCAKLLNISTTAFNPRKRTPITVLTKSETGEFYRSQAWMAIRYKVLAAYGAKCACCGETEGAMHVDHIKPRSKHPNLALEFSNLQVLCEACNMGKGNRDDTDWRTQEQAMKAAYRSTIS
jgi:hypothetical protein